METGEDMMSQLILEFYGDLTNVKNEHDQIQKFLTEERNSQYSLREEIQTLKSVLKDLNTKISRKSLEVPTALREKMMANTHKKLKNKELSSKIKNLKSLENELERCYKNVTKERLDLLSFSQDISKSLNKSNFAEEFVKQLRSKHVLMKDELLQKKRLNEQKKRIIRNLKKKISQKQDELISLETKELSDQEKKLLAQKVRWKNVKVKDNDTKEKEKIEMSEKKKIHNSLLSKWKILNSQLSELRDKEESSSNELLEMQLKIKNYDSKEETLDFELTKMKNIRIHSNSSFIPASRMEIHPSHNINHSEYPIKRRKMM